MKTKIKVINISKMKYNKQYIDMLMEKFKNTKENLDNTNKNILEKYNGYIVEDYISQLFKFTRNSDLFGWWNFKYLKDGKTIYYDRKTPSTTKDISSITKTIQRFNYIVSNLYTIGEFEIKYF